MCQTSVIDVLGITLEHIALAAPCVGHSSVIDVLGVMG